VKKESKKFPAEKSGQNNFKNRKPHDFYSRTNKIISTTGTMIDNAKTISRTEFGLYESND